MTIFATSNGGVSWAEQEDWWYDVLTGITCPTQTDCYAVGRTYLNGEFGGAILSTKNGGKKWASRIIPSLSIYLGPIACVGRRECYAAGTIIAAGIFCFGSITLRTTDAGKAWKRIG